MEERAALFFLVWPLRSKNDIFRCVSAAKLRKSRCDWTPPLACAVEAVLKMSCTQHGSILTRREAFWSASSTMSQPLVSKRMLEQATRHLSHTLYTYRRVFYSLTDYAHRGKGSRLSKRKKNSRKDFTNSAGDVRLTTTSKFSKKEN